MTPPPKRTLPGWMYSGVEESAASSPTVVKQSNLLHLLPRLKEYLMLVDPNRVDKAMELLANCQTEDELFSDLQAQYGDLVIEPVDDPQEANKAPSTKDKQKPKLNSPVKSQSTKSRPHSKSQPAPRKESKFIVDDSEDDSEDEDEEDESEYDESDDDESDENKEATSGIEEPDPDEDRPHKKSKTGVATQAPNIPVQVPIGPTVVCQYGRSCYRKNPAHFKEFAHPWRLDKPGGP